MLNMGMKRLLLDEVRKMREMQKAGNIDWFMPVAKFRGECGEIALIINEMVKDHVANFSKIAAVVGSYAEGDFSRALEELPGKEKVASDRMGLLRRNLSHLAFPTRRCSPGRRWKASSPQGPMRPGHQGDFKKIIQGVNDTLDAVTGPLRMAARYVNSIGKGTIPSRSPTRTKAILTTSKTA